MPKGSNVEMNTGIVSAMDNGGMKFKRIIRKGKLLRQLMDCLRAFDDVKKKAQEAPCEVLQKLVPNEELRVHLKNCPICVEFLKTLIDMVRKKIQREKDMAKLVRILFLHLRQSFQRQVNRHRIRTLLE